MFGIIIADYDEINLSNLKKEIKFQKVIINGFSFFLLNIHNKKIPLCISGIGKANAAAATATMINNFEINNIFNLGLCGTTRATIKIFTPIIAKSVEYFDVNVTDFGYKKNQIPYEKTKIFIKKKYIKKISILLNANNEKVVIGKIVSGDTFITKKNINFFSNIKNKIVGIDMELMAIAQICQKNKIDVFSLKFVSDLVFENKQHSTYKNSLKKLQKKMTDFLLKILLFMD